MRRTGDNYNRIRREVAGFRAIQDYLLGDYYPLTPYGRDERSWMVFQFDSPEKGGGERSWASGAPNPRTIPGLSSSAISTAGRSMK